LKEDNVEKKIFLHLKIKKTINRIFLMSLFFIIIAWSADGTNTSIINFLNGFPEIGNYSREMFPPDLTIIPSLINSISETIQIAVMGTLLGTLIAFPLSFMAARNVMKIKVVYQLTRFFFDICRGVSEVVWALLFVAMVGLGPFPGVLALTVHLAGALGRYFSEAIETVDIEIVRAIKATGASNIHVISNAFFPEIRPLIFNYILYYFEHSVRAATVLGLVGAGGIGFQLLTSIRLFRLNQTSTILIVMILLVVIIDRTSAWIRSLSTDLKEV